MVSITEQLEGLLPTDGNYTTKDERVIADAVAELRALCRRDREAWLDGFDFAKDFANDERLAGLGYAEVKPLALPPVWPRLVAIAALAFAAGCIASAIYVVLV